MKNKTTNVINAVAIVVIIAGSFLSGMMCENYLWRKRIYQNQIEEMKSRNPLLVTDTVAVFIGTKSK